MTGNGHMVAFMPRQLVGIFNRQYLLVLIGDNYHLGAALNAFLCTLRRAGVSTFGSALRIGNKSVYGGGVGSECHADHHERDAKDNKN
jgi:hypothetical protein